MKPLHLKNLPFVSRNRSGLKHSGSSQTDGSRCTDSKLQIMVESFGIVIPSMLKSSTALCATPFGAESNYLYEYQNTFEQKRILSKMYFYTSVSNFFIKLKIHHLHILR